MTCRSRPLAQVALSVVVLPAALLEAPRALAQTLPPAPASSAPAPPVSALPPLEGPRPPAAPVLASDETGVESVTFDDAVARALARNPTIGQAIQEVRRFHALMEQVRANSLPTLIGTANYTRLDHDRVSNGIVFVPGGSLNLEVTLNAPLLYPRGWLTWSEAGDMVAVARANEKDVRRTIAVSTAQAYLAILTQRRLLETARTAATTRRCTTSSRWRSGSGASETGSTRSGRRRSSRPTR
jgi:outer membrane protein TolC